MIKTETITINDQQFIKTYSDAGFMIHGGSPEADYADIDGNVWEPGVYGWTEVTI